MNDGKITDNAPNSYWQSPKLHWLLMAVTLLLFLGTQLIAAGALHSLVTVLFVITIIFGFFRLFFAFFMRML
ncbi:hypothetical protein [Dongshaea marina]|uniref:hypothetical protein n=1 Tax=Dongshaea marina TaxID=2047966 RepID=UPI000D3E3741|nr:hypothetical protein [Dongshaea marina]